MKRITRMYALLGEMIKSAERADKERILQLNKVYDILSRRVYSWPRPTELDLAYENCRQSSLFSVTMPELRGEFLKDAGEGYAKISRPSEEE